MKGIPAMIGIAFKHEQKHNYIPANLLQPYMTLAKKHQVDLCIFSFMQIHQTRNTVEALVYSFKQDDLMHKTVPVPRVNIFRNASYIVDQGLIDRFLRLRKKNIRFINFPLYRQANKLDNYEHLNSHGQLKGHVPPAEILSFEGFASFIRQYGKVIIKPVYGSRGRGITIAEKDHAGYQVRQTSFKKYAAASRKISLPPQEIKSFFHEAFPRPASFLVQKWIPLKEFNGRPFDVRAVMQKNGKNKWQVTSRVARFAREKGEITNLSQGGEMVSVSKLPLKPYHRSMRQFCLEIAKAFETLYPWAAEMGIDLALDHHGKLWYIETNYCPEKSRWSTLFEIPFEYACYLHQKQGRGIMPGQ